MNTNFTYEELPLDQAFMLQNPGGLVLLCTSGNGRYDLAPVAWCCPYEYSPVSKLLVVCDISHRTFLDARESGFFALALPPPSLRPLVKASGSVSGANVDKYAHFAISSMPSRCFDLRIPEGVSGWMECRLERVVEEGTSGILFGAVEGAWAVRDAWKHRIHYVSNDIWYRPGEIIHD